MVFNGSMHTIRRRTLNVMVISDAKNMKMAAPKIAL